MKLQKKTGGSRTFSLTRGDWMRIGKRAGWLGSLVKTANYEGVQGYFVAQTRSWQNCVCKKMTDGDTAHKAWETCLGEYQKGSNTLEWVAKNCLGDKIKKAASEQKEPFTLKAHVDAITKRVAAGDSVSTAVLGTLRNTCWVKKASIPPPAGDWGVMRGKLNLKEGAVDFSVAWDDGYGDYTIYFPTIEPGRVDGVEDQVLRVSDDSAAAKLFFEETERLYGNAPQKSVYEVYKELASKLQNRP